MIRIVLLSVTVLFQSLCHVYRMVAPSKINRLSRIMFFSTGSPLISRQMLVTTLFTNSGMNWILDGGADELWDEYVSALKNAGLDEFVAIYQAMYDRSQGGNK